MDRCGDDHTDFITYSESNPPHDGGVIGSMYDSTLEEVIKATSVCNYTHKGFWYLD